MELMPEQKLILVYVGPGEGAEIVRDVAVDRFEIQCLSPVAETVSRGLQRAAALLDASMAVRITKSMIDAAPHLRVVATATTGADHIDAHALAQRGIPLFTLQGQQDVLSQLTPAAEHSWLLLMACARRLVAARDHVLAGGWTRTEFPGIMLRGKTLGIIGCGRIGRWMARYAETFGMTCVGYDPHLHDWPPTIRRIELDQLLSAADFITVHVHLTEETRGLLGRVHFEQMKPGTIFINTSRGELIDEGALLEQLRNGRIAAAGLDVLSGEPQVRDHPLRQYAIEHDNLLVTPHIGGHCPEAVGVVVRFSAERILRHFGFSPCMVG